MNLDELKTTVDYTINDLSNKEDAKNIPVLITLSEGSIGARASSTINDVNMGFDWEHGQFRIEPSRKLVRKGNALTDVKEIIQREFEGRKYYVCPRCESKISKSDNYCRYCGQKLK